MLENTDLDVGGRDLRAPSAEERYPSSNVSRARGCGGRRGRCALSTTSPSGLVTSTLRSCPIRNLVCQDAMARLLSADPWYRLKPEVGLCYGVCRGVMRHYRIHKLATSLELALPCCMFTRTLERALILAPGSFHRRPPSNLACVLRAMELSPLTLRTDAYPPLTFRTRKLPYAVLDHQAPSQRSLLDTAAEMRDGLP